MTDHDTVLQNSPRTEEQTRSAIRAGTGRFRNRGPLLARQIPEFVSDLVNAIQLPRRAVDPAATASGEPALAQDSNGTAVSEQSRRAVDAVADSADPYAERVAEQVVSSDTRGEFTASQDPRYQRGQPAASPFRMGGGQR